jgi:hypothetical protein
VLDRIAAIEKEPYFKEDDVPSEVFRNAEMLAEELSEYIAFLDPDDIGTFPNGTATFRFETGGKTYFNLDIGRTTLAYVLSDQDSLFIPGEGKINQSTMKKINKLLKKYFIK